MRARHRFVLGTFVAALMVALAGQFAPATAVADGGHNCPASTSWDNFLQRCV